MRWTISIAICQTSSSKIYCLIQILICNIYEITIVIIVNYDCDVVTFVHCILTYLLG